MAAFYISVLVGLLTFCVCSIIEQLILGDRGRDNQIANYFKYIKGTTITEKKKEKVISKDQTKQMSQGMYIAYSMPVCIGIFIIIYLSSQSIAFAFIICLLGLLCPKAVISNRIKKKREILNAQLRDALSSIVSSLKAGLSINTALIKCSEDLEKLYSLLKDKPMLEEFNKIKSDLNMGMSVDDSLRNFMKRMQMEDVDDFVNSVIIVRQKGGNLVEVMENVSKMITDKIQMKREIDTLTASKKLEAKIMTGVPVVVIMILSIFSRNYMEPLYQSFIGKIFIGIGFTLLAVNYFVAKRIVDIQV